MSRMDHSNRLPRGLLVATVTLALANTLPASEPARPASITGRQPRPLDARRDILPWIAAYCSECHEGDGAEAGLDFEELLSVRPFVKHRDEWKNAAFLVEHRFMPPEDSKQPDETTRRKLVDWIRRQLSEFDYASVRHPGHEPARRLTHQEYDNTIRDLLGVDPRPASRFPSELSGTSGFENSANTLFLQPVLMERYIGAAEAAISAALPLKPTTDRQRKAMRRLLPVMPSSGTTDREAATRILGRFLPRAFRHPVRPNDIARYVDATLALCKSGATFERAIRDVMQAALVSPSFLMKVETTVAGRTPTAVSSHDLASRLSYFLWASMPDERLMELASGNTLQQPDVLDTEITRMLADPRSETLGTQFAGQWLGSVHLGTRIRADPIDNPWCTESLMSAMRSETAMFFVSLVRDNQPVTQLIEARHTFLNEELADFYGIEGIRGTRMRRVELKTPQRGGLIGQAALLTVTSFPGRTSPINRGRWVLANLLGTPPPPPPPGANELDEKLEEREQLTRRHKLALHRKDRRCAACHDRIDPLGLSLENYDWFGRWRARRRRRAIDASGRLPGGPAFSGPAGLRAALVKHRHDSIVDQVIRKLLAYALGRQLEYFDEAAVDDIRNATKAAGYRFQPLIRAIAHSYPFRYKQLRVESPFR